MKNYTERRDESALIQRLGYFLDLHHVELTTKDRKKLVALVNPKNKVHLGARRAWGTSGTLIKPRGIIKNVPRESLLEPRTGRRTRSFSERSK